MSEGAIVLMYHNIGTPPKNAALKSLYVTPDMFRFQMWYLSIAGFRVVALPEIVSFMHGNGTGKRLVAITFDDGYHDFYEHAFPVLRRHNFPCTVFLVSDLVGTENSWDREGVNTRKKLLDWGEILEIKDHGVTFGSHTKTHPFLSRLSREEIEREVHDSKKTLEGKLDSPVDFFCYPYGDHDQRVVTAVERAGYKGAVTVQRGLVHRQDDPFIIRRSFIRLHTHPLAFLWRLHSSYEDRKGGRI